MSNQTPETIPALDVVCAKMERSDLEELALLLGNRVLESFQKYFDIYYQTKIDGIIKKGKAILTPEEIEEIQELKKMYGITGVILALPQKAFNTIDQLNKQSNNG